MNSKNLFSKLISDAIKSVYLSLDEKVDNASLYRKSENILVTYINSLKENMSYIHLPYMADSRLLEELFVELYAFKTPIKYRLNESTNETTNKLGAKSILSEYSHLALLGEPGAGKTTFLKRAAVSICSSEDTPYISVEDGLFPIFLECRDEKLKKH